MSINRRKVMNYRAPALLLLIRSVVPVTALAAVAQAMAQDAACTTVRSITVE